MVRRRCVCCLLTVVVEPGAADRTSDRSALVAAHGVLALGVLTTAFVPGTVGVLAGGALFGATFVGIVGVGVDLARRLHAIDPTRAIAVMTVAFAVGQMIGPAVGGLARRRDRHLPRAIRRRRRGAPRRRRHPADGRSDRSASRQRHRPGEHRIDHRLGQPAGERVLLARMEARRASRLAGSSTSTP